MPLLMPLYDIEKSYAENLVQGPRFEGKIPERPPSSNPQDRYFLGYSIASPLGVPAGPLLDSRWTSLAAQLGYDLVTYKTIRSQKHSGHPLPNIIFVNRSEQDPNLAYRTQEPQDAAMVTITNSFGMPSMPETYLQEDIAKAKDTLKQGQLLIVSVVGTPEFSSDVPQDFIRTALLAKEAGAQAIEANFSCPNICSKEGALYCDSETACLIAKAMEKAVKPLPLMIKIGYFSNQHLLRQLLIGLARANVRAVCGINSFSMQVVDAENQPALGLERSRSGVCGAAIRTEAVQFVRMAHAIITQERLNLELAGCGGIMLPEHFDLFFEAGAQVAMSATGMMWDPYLASKWHFKKANHAK